MVKPQSSSSSSSCCDNKVNVIRNKGVVVQLQGGWGEEKDNNNNNASTFTYFSSSKHATPHSYSHPHPQWTSSIIPRKPGPKRCGKNSKLRWNNHNHHHNHNGTVRPTTAAADLCNKGFITFTQDEEDLIIKLHAAVGSRWGLIAHQLAGRTENDIKNHWNTKLRKKLSEMGIDPITHKPFSQILADYGNIGGIISTTTSSSSDSDSPNNNNNNNNNNNKYIIGTITTTRDLKKVVVKPADSTIITSTSSSSSPSSTFHSNSQLLSHTMSMSSLQNTYNTTTTTTHSLDLLSQLQAISLVAQPPYSNSNLPSSSYYNTTTADDFFPLPPPLKTSSISSTSANNPNSPDPGFSWHDFLLEVADEQEPFKPPQNHHPPVPVPVPVPVPDPDQLLAMEFSLTNHDYYDFQAHPTSSTLLTTPDANSSSLFMEAMLHQEDDMFLTFPGLMEEHLY